jgi:hypothetical protein
MNWDDWEDLTLDEKIGRADDSTLLVEICLAFMTDEDALDLGNYSLDEAKRMATHELAERRQ